MISVSASVGVGILTDQRPSRRIMAILACVMIMLGGALVFLGQSKPTFITAHILLLPVSGTLFGQLFAVARLVTAPLPRADRDGILAIVRATFAVPFVLLLPLWGLAFQNGLPLVTVYPATMLTGAGLLVLVWRHWPQDASAPWTEQKSGLGFRAALAEMGRPDVLARVMLIGTIHSGTALAGVILGLVFNQSAGRGTSDLGIFFAAFVLIEIVVTLLIGHLRRFMRRLNIIAMGVFTYAVFLALVPILASSSAVWLLVIPAGAGGAMIYALAIGYLQDLLGARAGAGSSLIALQRIAADGLCAIIFALGSWLSGYGLVATMGAVTMSAAMVAILWLDRNRPLEP
jgi:predicted MFS family arabinose efflux permease